MDFEVIPSYEAVIQLMWKRRLDGSINAYVQKFKLKKWHYGCISFEGNVDILNFIWSRVIERIYTDYLCSGVDVLTTNIFDSNSISQSCYSNLYDCNKLNERVVLMEKGSIEIFFYSKRCDSMESTLSCGF